MLNIVAYDDRSQKHPTDAHLPEWLPKHEFLMLIVAPAGSGKTTLLLNIILRIYAQYWQRILIFSPTINNDAKWEHVKRSNNVLMSSEKKQNSCGQISDGKKEENDEETQKENNTNKKGIGREDKGDENWCLSSEVEDIMQLKDNQIVDPFDQGNKDSRKKRRIGISKEWYTKAIGIPDRDVEDSEQDNNIYSREKKIQRERLLNKNERLNRLSAVLIRPPLPEMHKQLKNMTKAVFLDGSVPKRRKKRAEDDLTFGKQSHKPGRIGEEDGGKIRDEDLFEEYAEDTLVNAMKEIDDQVKESKENKENMSENVDRTLWVFDDMVGSGLFNNKRNNAFKRLTVRRRHYYSSLIGVTQAYKEIPKTTRTNANALVLFRIDSDEELQTIYREYPMGLKLKDWLKIVDYCTKEPYTFALFNLQTSDINQRIIRNFDEPLSLEKQAQILGHRIREAGSDGGVDSDFEAEQ